MINLVIPAAGSGTRFSKEIPKQFIKIQNKEVLIINLLNWVNITLIKKIYLILPKEKFEENKKKYSEISNKIIAVIGGNSRAESINNAISILDESNKLTLIHDGARPFCPKNVFERVVFGLEEYDAIIPALKITDTIKKIKNRQVIKTVNREELISVQTPQGFKTNLIKKAYKSINVKNSNFDDAELVENIGVEVFFVDGDKNNIKITTKDDIEYSEFLMSKLVR